MTTAVIMGALMAGMAIVLGDRRITYRQFSWWAAQSIALACFIVGRQL